MSVGALRSEEWIRTATPSATRYESKTIREVDRWSPEAFAREQIRGLVRQVFFANATHPIKQVVFSAANPGIDVGSICRRVGEALASETDDSVVVVVDLPYFQEMQPNGKRYSSQAVNEAEDSQAWRSVATRVRRNLWFLPETKIVNGGPDAANATWLKSHLEELRREFSYSVVEAPPAGESSEAAALGQLADGLILVLSAHTTRRTVARKIKETLDAARARLLGTVLSDRIFPIPEGIYRWL
jgi:hypothetical protein